MKDKRIYYILFFSAFLRLFRIDALTEFLGDQGRTSIILSHWPLPLAGPTTLSGAHLGPIFYYLLAPFGFDPLITSVWMAVLGVIAVYVLYKTVFLVYGNTPALLVALLYGVAPAIVKQDRIIWEPNLVPLFAILFCYVALKKNDFLLGVITAILVQLHYPNIFFIPLSAIVVGKNVKSILKYLAGCILILTPFLIYENQNNFVDVKNIIGVMGGGSTLGKRQILYFAYDYARRVIGMVIPLVPAWILLFGWVVVLFFRFTLTNAFLTFWFVFGVFSMARYNGVVYDHYLLFLLPPVLGVIASVFTFKKLYFIVIIFVCLQLFRTDIFSQGNNDIARTKSAVHSVLTDAGNTSFAFTLINSRSFSDLHYRYYFGNIPQKITNDSFKIFYLICDNFSCPSVSEVTSKQFIPVLCYDPHCEGQYPTLDMSQWRFDKLLQTSFGSSVYEFIRM